MHKISKTIIGKNIDQLADSIARTRVLLGTDPAHIDKPMEKLKGDFVRYMTGRVVGHAPTSASKKIFFPHYPGRPNLQSQVFAADNYIKSQAFGERDRGISFILTALNEPDQIGDATGRIISDNIRSIWGHIEYCVNNKYPVFKDFPREWTGPDEPAKPEIGPAGIGFRSNTKASLSLPDSISTVSAAKSTSHPEAVKHASTREEREAIARIIVASIEFPIEKDKKTRSYRTEIDEMLDRLKKRNHRYT